jgi:hypothetical protein
MILRRATTPAPSLLGCFRRRRRFFGRNLDKEGKPAGFSRRAEKPPVFFQFQAFGHIDFPSLHIIRKNPVNSHRRQNRQETKRCTAVEKREAGTGKPKPAACGGGDRRRSFSGKDPLIAQKGRGTVPPPLCGLMNLASCAVTSRSNRNNNSNRRS